MLFFLQIKQFDEKISNRLELFHKEINQHINILRCFHRCTEVVDEHIKDISDLKEVFMTKNVKLEAFDNNTDLMQFLADTYDYNIEEVSSYGDDIYSNYNIEEWFSLFFEDKFRCGKTSFKEHRSLIQEL